MILWPSVLPQYLRQSGYSEQLAAQVIRTQMDAGPAKARRRFTAAPRPVTGEIVVTADQLAFFRTWYDAVLLGGSMRFGWVEPGSAAFTNLVTNGGFDSATTGWSTSDCSLASITGGQYGNCLELTPTATENAYAIQNPTLTVGNRYNVEAYIKEGSASGAVCYVGIYRTDTFVWVEEENCTIPQNWTHVSFEFVAPITDPRIMLGKIYDAGIPGTMLFDQVMLVDITTGIAEMRFVDPPVITPHGVEYRISMKLEILP